MHLVVEAEGSGTQAAMTPTGSAAPTMGKQNGLGSALLHRDFAHIVSERTKLFAPAALPAFARTLTELAPLFGGADLEETLLPGIDPWLELIVEPVSFDEGAQPELPLPAAAVVARLETGEVGEELISAFQTIISLTNFEAANAGRKAHRLTLALEGDVVIHLAKLPRPGPEEGVDMVYNLQPACAVVGDRFILATHEALVRELIRSGGAPVERPSATRERLRIDGVGVARVLQANFDALVMNKVVSDGVEIEEARAEIGGLVGLVDLLGTLEVEIDRSTDERVAVRIVSRASGAKHGR